MGIFRNSIRRSLEEHKKIQEEKKINRLIKFQMKFYKLSEKEAREKVIKNHNRIMEGLGLDKKEAMKKNFIEKQEQGIVCCPKCGSTSISAKRRGSYRIRNHCMNCGHIFNPGNRFFY